MKHPPLPLPEIDWSDNEICSRGTDAAIELAKSVQMRFPISKRGLYYMAALFVLPHQIGLMRQIVAAQDESDRLQRVRIEKR